MPHRRFCVLLCDIPLGVGFLGLAHQFCERKSETHTNWASLKTWRELGVGWHGTSFTWTSLNVPYLFCKKTKKNEKNRGFVVRLHIAHGPQEKPKCLQDDANHWEKNRKSLKRSSGAHIWWLLLRFRLSTNWFESKECSISHPSALVKIHKQ